MICKKCSFENEEGRTTCEKCGAPLDEMTVSDAAPDTQPDTAAATDSSTADTTIESGSAAEGSTAPAGDAPAGSDAGDAADAPSPDDADAAPAEAPDLSADRDESADGYDTDTPSRDIAADLQDDMDAQMAEDTDAASDAGLDVTIASDAESQALMDISGKKETKKRSKIMAFSGLIALVVICAGLWVAFTGILAPKYDVPVDRSKYPISYVKDDTLYIKPVSGATTQVSAALSTAGGMQSYDNTVKQSKNGKTVAFLENYDSSSFSGTLFVSYDGRTKQQIAENAVQGFMLSDDGKTILYMTDVDPQTATGKLWYFRQGIEAQLVADITYYNSYKLSANGKYVSFLDGIDSNTAMGALYVANVGKPRVQLDESAGYVFKVSDNGNVLYSKNYDEMTYTCDLYRASEGREPELISSGVNESYTMTSNFSDKVAFLTIPQTNVFDFSISIPGRAAEPIMSNIAGFFKVDIENENFLLAQMPEGADQTTTNPSMLLKKKGKEPVSIAANLLSPQHAAASYDMNTIYYLADYDQTTNTGSLHKWTSSLFGGVKDEVIASEVYAFVATPDAKTIAYLTNVDMTTGIGTLSAYHNGATKQIAESIYAGAFTLSNNGKSILFVGDMDTQTYLGTLYSVSTTGSSEPTQIDTGVYAQIYSRSDKNAIYQKNIDETTGAAELYIWKGSGTPEMIDSGVTAVLFED